MYLLALPFKFLNTPLVIMTIKMSTAVVTRWHLLPADLSTASQTLTAGCPPIVWKLNTDKTELLWAASKFSHAPLGNLGPSLQLGIDTVTASDHVRVLGVTFSCDPSLEKHVSIVCSTCFYWLRQLRRVRRSLDAESVSTLVHAFVTSRVDYCNAAMLF